MKVIKLNEAFDNKDVFIQNSDVVPEDAGIAKEELDKLDEGGASIKKQQAWEDEMIDIDSELGYGNPSERRKRNLTRRYDKLAAKFAKQREYERQHPEEYPDMYPPEKKEIVDTPEAPEGAEPALVEEMGSAEERIGRYEVDIPDTYNYMMDTTHNAYMDGKLSAEDYAKFLAEVYDALDSVKMPNVELAEGMAPVMEKRDWKPHTKRLLKLIGEEEPVGEALGVGAGLALAGGAIGAGMVGSALLDDMTEEETKNEETLVEDEDKVDEGLIGDINVPISLDASGSSVGFLGGTAGLTNEELEDEDVEEFDYDDDYYDLDEIEQDRAHAALYGGDREYCDCGKKLAHDEWGAYCPVCSVEDKD